MNEFLKNLRSAQKDRAQGSSRSHSTPYPHPDRRAGADRRDAPPRRSPYQATETILQGIGEALNGIHGLLQAVGTSVQQIADACDRRADIEERRLEMLEKLLPLAGEVLARLPQTGDGGEEREASSSEDAGEMPVRRVSREERKMLVQRIRSMREDGATYDQIAEYLEKNQIPTFSSKGKWHAQTIHRLCRMSGE